MFFPMSRNDAVIFSVDSVVSRVGVLTLGPSSNVSAYVRASLHLRSALHSHITRYSTANAAHDHTNTPSHQRPWQCTTMHDDAAVCNAYLVTSVLGWHGPQSAGQLPHVSP
jgi:hypothetical protein